MSYSEGPMEGPRHPTKAEYPALIKFLSKSYGFSDPRWFEKDTPTYFGASQDRLATKWLLKSGNRIASHVGIFPFTALVGSSRLKVAGIGSVATHPDFRGRGLMKRLMDHAVGEMEKAGYDLSILWGERGLYGHYGYERALYQDRFEFTQKTLKYSIVPKGVRPARNGDGTSLRKMFARQFYRVERTAAYSLGVQRRFSRDWPEPAWVLEEGGKTKAYVIVSKSPTGTLEVAEWGGETEDVVCLMATVLQKKDLRWLTLSLYPGTGLYRWACDNNDNQERTSFSSMIRVFKLGKVLKAFEEQLRDRALKSPIKIARSLELRSEKGDGVVLRFGKGLSVSSSGKADRILSLSDREVTTLLFGCGRPSVTLGEKLAGLEWLDGLFPLDWFWWRSDWI